jgi:hypothetical protein
VGGCYRYSNAINAHRCFDSCKADASGRKLSASAFQEIVGQAVKNLAILTPNWDCDFDKNTWNGPWKSNKQSVTRRIRVPLNGGMTAKKAFDQFDRLLKNPSTRREVWIVMAQGLSLSEFEKEREKISPQPSVIQMLFLLQSTWAAVSSVGSQFRIFCSV